MKKTHLLVIGIFSSLFTSSVNSATLVVDPADNVVTGATGVTTGGTVYNVEFKDGSCIGLLDGCDDINDFGIQSTSDLLLALQALSDQVLVDNVHTGYDLDTNPIVRGCTASAACFIGIPYWTSDNAPQVGRFRNDDDESSDFFDGSAIWAPQFNSNFSGGSTHAIFTVSNVPLPPALWLFGTAVLGLGGWRNASHYVRRVRPN